jgi:hypothetical protein
MDNVLESELNQRIIDLTSENNSLKNEIVVLRGRIAELEKVSKMQSQFCNVVDLGLPSGTLWADRNIGASSPEECGEYFAWGEITTKDGEYSLEEYDYCNHPQTLPPSNDAATQNWNNEWCMPTKEQFELIKSNCSLAWLTVHGQKGTVVRANSGFLLLPAEEETCGGCWSSTKNDNLSAWFFCFDSVGESGVLYTRFSHEYSVRPFQN